MHIQKVTSRVDFKPYFLHRRTHTVDEKRYLTYLATLTLNMVIKKKAAIWFLCHLFHLTLKEPGFLDPSHSRGGGGGGNLGSKISETD